MVSLVYFVNQKYTKETRDPKGYKKSGLPLIFSEKFLSGVTWQQICGSFYYFRNIRVEY